MSVSCGCNLHVLRFWNVLLKFMCEKGVEMRANNNGHGTRVPWPEKDINDNMANETYIFLLRTHIFIFFFLFSFIFALNKMLNIFLLQFKQYACLLPK